MKNLFLKISLFEIYIYKIIVVYKMLLEIIFCQELKELENVVITGNFRYDFYIIIIKI